MEEDENVFPLDITERKPGARPWKFRPDGYLVVVCPTMPRQSERRKPLWRRVRSARHQALSRQADPGDV